MEVDKVHHVDNRAAVCATDRDPNKPSSINREKKTTTTQNNRQTGHNKGHKGDVRKIPEAIAPLPPWNSFSGLLLRKLNM